MKKALLAIAAVVAVAALGVGAWIALGDGGEAVARQSCADKTTALSVEDDDGGLEVSFELQSVAPGEAWSIVLTQGDTTLLEGERQTDEDAEIDIDAIADENGSDRFTAVATPIGGGESCTATVTR